MGRAYQNRKESMAKTSDAKAKVYSRYGREIYVCAKQSGCEPDGNLALRSLIDRAKKDQVPSHVIEKAIVKAKGGGGEDYASAIYEGYGPGSSMVMIECLTDNPNRTFGDVRLCFTKTKCKIGTQGTVSHMFDHSAIFVFKHDDEDAVLEALMMDDVDVSDIESDDGIITIFVPNTDYFKAKQALTNAFGEIDFDVSEIQYIPQNIAPIDEDARPMFEKFIDMINDVDDVQNVYHNLEF
ncbi:MAG: YebC/PmpR family DNA-binding regulatory protein [Pseudohongiellaceae bacterium]|jgi:YebC/PmpR family DNA-binding regulatory protein